MLFASVARNRSFDQSKVGTKERAGRENLIFTRASMYPFVHWRQEWSECDGLVVYSFSIISLSAMLKSEGIRQGLVAFAMKYTIKAIEPCFLCFD